MNDHPATRATSRRDLVAALLAVAIPTAAIVSTRSDTRGVPESRALPRDAGLGPPPTPRNKRRADQPAPGEATPEETRGPRKRDIRPSRGADATPDATPTPNRDARTDRDRDRDRDTSQDRNRDQDRDRGQESSGSKRETSPRRATPEAAN